MQRPASTPPPLDHEEGTVRGAILARIHDHPGVIKTDLCGLLDIAWGTCTYHVEVLERTGRIQRVCVGRRVHLFSAEVHGRRAHWLAALLQPNSRTVVEAMGRRQSTIKDIMDRSRLGRKVVTNRVQDLLDAGLVEYYGVGRPRYRATDQAYDLLRGVA